MKSRFLMLEFVAIILRQVSVNTKLIFEKIEINNFLVLKPWKNVDWAPSVFNHARAAPKAKLVMKDQSRKRHEKVCEKRDKSLKKKLSTEEENVPVINNQLSEDNTDIDLVITSFTDCSVKDIENQLLQQKLNETKTLLLKYQMDSKSFELPS